MLYEILDETLSKLDECEKQNPNEILYKQVSYTSLKSQIKFFKDFWTEPKLSQLEKMK